MVEDIQRNDDSIELIHRGAPTAHPLQEYVLWLEERLSPNSRYVIDRWHVGQHVYPTIYPEGRDALKSYEWFWIELYLLSRGAIMIGTTGDENSIRERLLEDQASYLKPADAALCLELFQESYFKTILPTYAYDFDHGMTPPARAYIEAADIQDIRYDLWHEFPYVIGNTLDPEYLLVGDTLGKPNPPEATHLVPFAPYPGASGRYLMQALLQWPKHLRSRIAIVNAYRPDGEEEDLFRLWRLLGQPKTVTLGRNACVVGHDLIPHGSVPHPQWVRRFKHNKQDLYAHMIRLAGYTEEEYYEEFNDAD